ncbi:glyoxalase [Pararhodobacter oceanensis]|uniref:Glyoxalase n=1 Tax=Pararhodobacter oceanensis TaxID=2172121 RepID=A0A2T8HSW7_9RHOB|nr:VOC family protein [Pararhodobacter oceanensis]PVH28544.1 glyoxalase [Pararhodobacter oceanensis]
MPAQRVTLITLGVQDLARSMAFYARLGWTPDEQTESVAFYDLGGMKLGLFGLEALAADQGRAGAELGVGAVTLAQNYADRAGVDAAFALAEAAGAELLKRPEAVFWGGYSGYFADPDGHVWELAHNPFWGLDGNGKLTSA